MKLDYLRWLNKAGRHLKTANLNNANDGFRDTTCYFCHQTVELALKAYLIFKKIDFPKVHALPKLISLCSFVDESFSELYDDCAFLNGFYIEAKYPLDIASDPTIDETSKAITSADKILKFVENKIS